VVQDAADKQRAPQKRAGKTTMPGGAQLGQDASREAKRVAAGILEVLAGQRTPAQAARELGMCLPRYYVLENRALRGLVAACEPRPKGRVRSVTSELTSLRQDNERLQRELSRQQALVRLAQRTVGLSPAAPAPAKPGKKTRKRRPVVRALNVAQRLRQDDANPAAVPAGTPAQESV
jgi:hypothetical protein